MHPSTFGEEMKKTPILICLAIGLSFACNLSILHAETGKLFDATDIYTISDSAMKFKYSDSLNDEEKKILDLRYSYIERHYEIRRGDEYVVSECFRRAMHGRTPKEVVVMANYCAELESKKFAAEFGDIHEVDQEAPPYYVDPDRCVAEETRNNTFPRSEKQLAEAITGYWAEENTSYYGIVNFGGDGYYEGRAWETHNKKKLIFTVKGRWWIKKRLLYTSTIEDIDKRDPSFDLIISISDSKLSLRAPDGIYHRSRVNGF